MRIPAQMTYSSECKSKSRAKNSDYDPYYSIFTQWKRKAPLMKAWAADIPLRSSKIGPSRLLHRATSFLRVRSGARETVSVRLRAN